jgi:hypothetical protein
MGLVSYEHTCQLSGLLLNLLIEVVPGPIFCPSCGILLVYIVLFYLFKTYCWTCILVDEKLASFLDQEIASESKTEASIDTIEGWDIKTDGTGVILTKKFNVEM